MFKSVMVKTLKNGVSIFAEKYSALRNSKAAFPIIDNQMALTWVSTNPRACPRLGLQVEQPSISVLKLVLKK